MDEFFRSERPLADREVYEKLRNLGMFWQPRGSWERGDRTVVFISEQLSARFEERYQAQRRAEGIQGGDSAGRDARNTPTPGTQNQARRYPFQGRDLRAAPSHTRPLNQRQLQLPEALPHGPRHGRSLLEYFNLLARDNGTWRI